MRLAMSVGIGLVSAMTILVPAFAAVGSASGAKSAQAGLQRAADQCFGKEKVGWAEVILACEVLLKAKVKPDVKAGAYFNRGSAYLRLGGGKNALADFNAALKIQPTFARALEARAGILTAQNKYDQALADLNKAISLDPKSSVAFNNRGMVYLAKKNFPKAIADLTKAVDLAPSDPQSYAARASAYIASGDAPKAFADLDKAIAMDSKLIVALFNRGTLFAANGEKDKAKKDFRSVLAIDPGNKRATEQLTALEKAGG
ncbi:MAG: tetratricopeptide repeat protein [Alphaproteobacteria bacterium]|nr:tetratricopeptide repeat protein [Alphaproteobacteria bacterium]